MEGYLQAQQEKEGKRITQKMDVPFKQKETTAEIELTKQAIDKELAVRQEK